MCRIPFFLLNVQVIRESLFITSEWRTAVCNRVQDKSNPILFLFVYLLLGFIHLLNTCDKSIHIYLYPSHETNLIEQVGIQFENLSLVHVQALYDPQFLTSNNPVFSIFTEFLPASPYLSFSQRAIQIHVGWQWQCRSILIIDLLKMVIFVSIKK